MKRFTLLIFHLIALNGFSQKTEILDGLAQVCTETTDQVTFKKNVLEFTSKLRASRSTSDARFLKKAFYRTHRKFLKEYQPYSSVSQLFKTGKYDCLTATSLYSSILEVLGFDFKIIETNYHIFILAKAEGKEFLLETTDGLAGFICSEEEIVKRKLKYHTSEPSNMSNGSYSYDFLLFNEVKGSQLRGLLYFNQAVKEFNNHNWITCLTLLNQSEKIYPSPRIEEIRKFACFNFSTSKTDFPKQASSISDSKN